MTTSLLVVREYIRNFYVKYEEYAVPALKFLLALVSLLLINAQLGYMSQINGAAAVLIVSLICSFMPKNFTLFAAAGFVTLHLYEVSLECAGVALVVFLLLFLLYFRFTPKGAVLVMLTPLLFILRIPYAAPILAGLLGNPLSAVTVACGVVVYYLVSYMSMNASLLSSAAAESMLTRTREILDGVFGNREMLIIAAAFAVTTILVYLVRRLSVDYSWTIAIVSGALLDIVVILVGDLIYDADFSIPGVLLGSVGGVLVTFVVQFFRFNLDYSRTEKVQFEDDEYYYYVKAVPKAAVTTPEKKVKKITTQRNNRRVRHTNTRDAAHRQRE
ncbi:MAG TPA: hypothetical protein H9761_04490 [Candidatus Eisenbergiella merdavium]|uniref:Uncharacterized protein n=1 Tax=Candidatus Eisenbergiella merdavium TaxID=2838551 RepID=A0A9D2NEN6_9FIRM|nr:hypothetical protein [Candidatus Eisenbergiella merdavium]